MRAMAQTFSVITRPYILRDWELAFAEAKQSLRNYLWDDANLEDIGQRGPCETLLRKLQSLEQASDCETLQNLILVTRALLYWPEEAAGTRFWNDAKHFQALQADEHLLVKINHPKSEAFYTLEIKLDQITTEANMGSGSCWIARGTQWTSFKQGYENLLYLTAYREFDYIEFSFSYENAGTRQTLYSYYQKVNTCEIFPEHNTRFCYDEKLGTFFREVKPETYEANAHKKTAHLKLAEQTNEVLYQSYQSIGWLNPLILTFEKQTNDIAPINQKAEELVNLLLQKPLILHFEPHLSEINLARIRYLKYLRTGSQRNVIAHLLYGSGNDASALVLLDGLGGQFHIEGFGQKLKIKWVEPLESREHWLQSFLDAWLKDYLLSLCPQVIKGTRQYPSKLQPIQAATTPSRRSSHGCRRIPLSKGEHVDEIKSEPFIEILSQLPEDHETQNQNHILWHIASFLKDLQRLAPKLYFGLDSCTQGSEMLVFDELSFLEGFAENYLSFTSPILITLPRLEKQTLVLNLIDSKAYPHKSLLERLYASLSQPLQSSTRILYCYGWWQDWYEALFYCRWDASIRFYATDDFVLEQSRLGNRLGKARIGRRYAASTMRL
jgi:hypothetical protein